MINHTKLAKIKQKHPFFKFCRICDKRFNPTGKAQKICPECTYKRFRARWKNYKPSAWSTCNSEEVKEIEKKCSLKVKGGKEKC